MKRKIIIFGGQGFIGSNLTNFYLKKNYEVISIGRLSDFSSNKKKLSLSHKFKIFECDFFNITKFNQIDFNDSNVIFAGLNGKIKIREFKKKFSNLIIYLMKKKINKFILLSSISVYGDTRIPVNELSKTQPINLYAKNCLAAEKIVSKNLSKFKNKFIVLRIANVFGIPNKNPSMIEKIILNNLFDKKFTFYKKNLIRSYIEINTLIKIIYKLITIKDSLFIYNISNPHYIFSFKDICSIFENNLKISNKIIFNTQKPLIIKSICNTNEIQKVFNFNEKFVFEIKKIINYYKKLKI